MRKEVWFGLAIMAAVVVMLFLLMPSPSQIPKDLKDFSDLHAAELSSGRDFDVHAERLMVSVENVLNQDKF